ncbi:hypothetical protein [Amaricoccus sp.]|nr:hypothetical protein [Amaricoccus sp.]MBP6999984.1 hypothetical protein [Amaricoccus sp.]
MTAPPAHLALVTSLIKSTGAGEPFRGKTAVARHAVGLRPARHAAAEAPA